MDVRALRYFVETVRFASFTQAAKALFVTQSTVSKMIRQLEDELGTPLLIRDGHHARPTDTGRIVFEQGQQILNAVAQLSAEVRETVDTRRGELQVGIPPMINLLFTPVVKRFREIYPEIRLSLREETGQAVERLVTAGELEVGASILPSASDSVLSWKLFGSYPIWAIGPKTVSWAGQRSLSFSALRDTPLLLLSDDFAITRRLRHAFHDAGFEPRIAAQSDHWDFLIAMASADLGVALLPEPLLQRIKTHNLSSCRLVKPKLHWDVGHIWRKDRYLSYAARAWLAVCNEVLDAPQ